MVGIQDFEVIGRSDGLSIFKRRKKCIYYIFSVGDVFFARRARSFKYKKMLKTVSHIFIHRHTSSALVVGPEDCDLENSSH